ncbi:uncharacterized protein LOC127003104 [Eriocheir sinensis]|uniref:uncharacterized protein LOC127003104 n=1 Tax=Eriocheir sinensis TaxID=95602 RepID=UPI0021C75C96|nr:uncharacterized protein LOC127003104 [Eriocheir sinensis]
MPSARAGASACLSPPVSPSASFSVNSICSQPKQVAGVCVWLCYNSLVTMGLTIQTTAILLIIVTIIAIYGVSRNSFDEKFASVLVARCINTSSSNSARPSPPPTRAPRDGAFYREADIATWDEDWGKGYR